MIVRVLGPLQVEHDDQSIALGPKERILLARLVASAGRMVEDAVLADVLWPDLPRSWRKTLHGYVLRCRRAIGPAHIVREGTGYRLVGVRTDVDLVDGFLEDAAQARSRGDVHGAAACYRSASALFRGRALPELDDDLATIVERRRLEELERRTGEDLLEAEIAAGRAATVIGQLEALVARWPTREHGWVLLVRALLDVGRRDDALAALGRARTALAHELGIEPGAELRELEIAALEPLPTQLRPIEPSGPTATVALLFTDVVESTALWAEDRDGMSASLVLHDQLIQRVAAMHSGRVFSTAGDSFAIAFAGASDALTAASLAQLQLAASEWPGPVLLVRMGLHVGEAQLRDGNYFGPAVNLAARIAAAGHGGQILLSETVRPTAGSNAHELGSYRLKGVTDEVKLFQLGTGQFPPLRAHALRSNLPAPPNELIGRDDEIDAVRRLVRDASLVTIVAGGGMGKTRLALAVGALEVPGRAGGVWFVDLRSIRDGEQVPAAVSDTLGVVLVPGDAIDQLAAALGGALIILDNCEHLIDACAGFVERTLAKGVSVTFLSTSREPLQIDAERVFVLSTLGVGAGRSPAAELFSQRARDAAPDVVLPPGAATTISRICQRLDGLPLAIELAAGRVRVMSLDDLLDGLDDRFALLTTRRRDRQGRTLEATLDWSYDLLTAHEQRTLRACSVFADTFETNGVADVTGLSPIDALDVVDALVGKSLIVRVDASGSARFRLLETVRAYAALQLDRSGELEAVQAALADHVLRMAAQHAPTWVSEMRLGLRLAAMRADIITAFEWAIRYKRWEDATDLLAGSVPAFDMFGRATDVLAMLRQLLDHWREVDNSRADQVAVLSIMPAVVNDDFETVAAMAAQISNSNIPYLRAVALGLVSWLHALTDQEAALGWMTGAVDALNDARSNQPGRNTECAAAYLHFVRSCIYGYGGDHIAALREAEAAVELEAAVDYLTVSGTFAAIPVVAVCRIIIGDPLGAVELLDGEYEIMRSIDYVNGDELRALAHLSAGNVELGRAIIREHALRALSHRYRREATDSMLLCAALAAAEDDRGRACDLLAASGVGRQPATIIYGDVLARQLGMSDDYRRNLSKLMPGAGAAPEDPLGARAAATALRAEIQRCGWR